MHQDDDYVPVPPRELEDDHIGPALVRLVRLDVQELGRKIDLQSTVLGLIKDAIADLRGQIAHAFEQIGRTDGRQDAHAEELRNVRRDVDELKRRVTELERIEAAELAVGRK